MTILQLLDVIFGKYDSVNPNLEIFYCDVYAFRYINIVSYGGYFVFPRKFFSEKNPMIFVRVILFSSMYCFRWDNIAM